MKKQTLAAIAATFLFACSSASAQNPSFLVTPSDLGVGSGGATSTAPIDISNIFGLGAGEVIVQVNNALATASNSFTVGAGQDTTFTFSGNSQVQAIVNHGANLGSPSGTTGPGSPRDGIRANGSDTFTLVNIASNTLESDYQLFNPSTATGSDYFVQYTGTDTGNVETNEIFDAAGNPTEVGFAFVSNQAVSTFGVFSSNTSGADRNDNFTTRFRVVSSAIPEPSSAVLIALGGLLALRRRKRS